MSRILLEGHVQITCSPANSAHRPGELFLDSSQRSIVSGFKTSMNGEATTLDINAEILPPESELN